MRNDYSVDTWSAHGQDYAYAGAPDWGDEESEPAETIEIYRIQGRLMRPVRSASGNEQIAARIGHLLGRAKSVDATTGFLFLVGTIALVASILKNGAVRYEVAAVVLIACVGFWLHESTTDRAKQ